MAIKGFAGDGIAVATAIERELASVASAIAMVASGASERVTIASLQFGPELVEPARLIASASGVRILPLWTTDAGDRSLTVEAIPAE
jgi:hypothetical protein